ncbi:hypothetical protein ACFE04_006438 [Oxalis oulophora]
MGLGNYNTTATNDGGVGCCGGSKCLGSVSCSICLEVVADDGDRSWAKLQCGHQFHLERLTFQSIDYHGSCISTDFMLEVVQSTDFLVSIISDCIGSAFNVKGAMQCPNCRKIEKGQWLYANGSRSSQEHNMDDWAHDEDLYDLDYSEMSFGVHWCPFDSFAQPPSSFEEGEFSSTAYHDLLGQHAVSSSSSHPCPYFTYVGSSSDWNGHPSHQPSSSNSSESISDNLNFNNHWNGHSSASNNVPISHGFPPIDLNNHSWEHDQPSAPPVSVSTQRQARISGLPQSGSFMHHPFLPGQSSGVRAPSPVIPPYPGSNARARNRDQALQAYYHHQQPANSPATRSSNRRSHRNMGQIGQGTSSSDRPGVHHYRLPATVDRSFNETENNRFHAWESDHLPSISWNQLDLDLGWGIFYEGTGGSEHGVRPINFRQRHESERNWCPGLDRWTHNTFECGPGTVV